MPDFNDLLNLDFRWPVIGDRLFVNSHSVADAPIPRDSRERLYHMTKGYKEAADVLVEQTISRYFVGRSLVYPIIFCYRHFLELSLKTLLKEYGDLGNVPANWSDHRLESLWQDFRLLLRNIGCDHPEDQAVDVVEECIAEFAKIDPQSMTFRYPVSKKGLPLDVDFDAVNLLQLRDTMRAIENYFLGSDGYLDSLQGALP